MNNNINNGDREYAALWAWLEAHGFGHWGKCSAEGIRHSIVHGSALSALTPAELDELSSLAESAILSDEAEEASYRAGR